jgi:hypothetical protein
MGCTKMLSEKNQDRYTSQINSTPFQEHTITSMHNALTFLAQCVIINDSHIYDGLMDVGYCRTDVSSQHFCN